MIDFNTELNGSSSAFKVLKEAGAKEQKGALQLVPFDKLVILPDFNVREMDSKREERVRKIADSLKDEGYRPEEPMTVFVDDTGRIIVTEGHTRYDAILLAKSEGAENLDVIPVIPMKAGTTMLDLTVNLVRANDKERLSPLGMSVVAKRLTTTFKLTEADAARRMGVTPKYVKDMLILAGAPTRARELIIAGAVSATLVIDLFREHGAEVSMQMIEEGLAESTTTNTAGEKVVRKKNIKPPKAPKTAEEIKDELIKSKAQDLFQFVSFLLAVDSSEELSTEEKKDQTDKWLDKLDIIVTHINTEVELKAGSLGDSDV